MATSGSKLFWIEAVLAGLTGFLALLTLITREWIELIFGVDPDHGHGSLEWLIVLVTGAAAVVLSVLARREWRRQRPAVDTG